MKRLFLLAVTVAAVGVLATACTVTPPAATVNGATITTGALYGQLRAYDTTAAGQCLLSLENGQFTALQTAGMGGSGTYDMAFTDSILDSSIGYLVAAQYAASKGITVSPSDLSAAKNTLEATLAGEIAGAAQQASQSGGLSVCQRSNGQSMAASQLLAGLPSSTRQAQIRNEAVDEKLLAAGARLSMHAADVYYLTHLSLFQTDCVSVIQTDTQAHGNQLVAQINGGASFASVAKASSLDPQSAAAGGAIGCSITQAQLEQALQQQSIPVAKPIGPIQDAATSSWVIYEVTKQTLEPLSAALPLIHQALLQAPANVSRVSALVTAFAKRSSVTVDPQYGTWNAQVIVAPVRPPARDLLPAGV